MQFIRPIARVRTLYAPIRCSKSPPAPSPPPAKLCNGAISYMYTHVRAQVDNQGLSLLFNFSLVRETGAWQRASLGGAPRSVCPDPQASRCSAHHANHTAPLQVEGLGLSFALVALDATTGARAAPPPHTHTHTSGYGVVVGSGTIPESADVFDFARSSFGLKRALDCKAPAWQARALDCPAWPPRSAATWPVVRCEQTRSDRGPGSASVHERVSILSVGRTRACANGSAASHGADWLCAWPMARDIRRAANRYTICSS